MPDPIETIEEPEVVETTETAPPTGFGGLGEALKAQVPGLTEETTHDTSKYTKKAPDSTTEEVVAPVEKTLGRAEDGKFKAAEVEEPKTVQAIERDADLHAEIDATVRPKTRKIIESSRAQAIAARNERDAEKARVTEWETRFKELETKLKTSVAPKELEDELVTLRTRVRELDISKDPALETKYDAVIKKNAASALELLKGQGLFSRVAKAGEAPVEIGEAEKRMITAEIEKSGTGLRGMAKYIRVLEQGGEYEAAERLRALAQHTDRLAADKSEEIGKWSKDYEGFQATRTREQQQRQEAYSTAVRSHGEKALQADLTELQKQIPFLAPPPAVLPADSAEIKTAKQKAITEYEGAIASLQAGAKTFNTDGLSPEKAAEVNGKMTASAIQSLILKGHVIPRLLKEATANAARIKELETEVGKIRKAGSINRAHSAALSTSEQGRKVPDASLSLAEALQATLSQRNQGVD